LSRKTWKGLRHENQGAKKHLLLFGIHNHLILLVLPYTAWTQCSAKCARSAGPRRKEKRNPGNVLFLRREHGDDDIEVMVGSRAPCATARTTRLKKSYF
jgi:hypothetical protein